MAPMIPIRWVASDLSNLETHPLTPGLTLATTAGSGTSGTRTTTDSSLLHESTKFQLSAGDLAVIVVGTLVFAFVLCVVVFWALVKRPGTGQRRGESAEAPPSSEKSGVPEEGQELDRRTMFVAALSGPEKPGESERKDALDERTMPTDPMVRTA